MVVLITGSNNSMNDSPDHKSEHKNAEMTVVAAAVKEAQGSIHCVH